MAALGLAYDTKYTVQIEGVNIVLYYIENNSFYLDYIVDHTEMWCEMWCVILKKLSVRRRATRMSEK